MVLFFNSLLDLQPSFGVLRQTRSWRFEDAWFLLFTEKEMGLNDIEKEYI